MKSQEQACRDIKSHHKSSKAIESPQKSSKMLPMGRLTESSLHMFEPAQLRL
jgi:hypothetical protein